VLEEPALNVGSQIIPFADRGGTQTFQDSAFHIPQIAGLMGYRPRQVLRSASSSQRSRAVAISSPDVGLRPFLLTTLVYSPLLAILISKPAALIATMFPNEKNSMRVKPLLVSDEAAQRSGGLPTLVPFR
jgi:hypothetical protein